MLRLKELRTRLGKYQKDIAKDLDMSVQVYCNYEKEQRQLTPETIIKFAHYFNVSTDYLLGLTDYENSQNKKTPLINEDEMALIEKYRQMDDSYKSLLMQMADNMVNNNNSVSDKIKTLKR